MDSKIFGIFIGINTYFDKDGFEDKNRKLRGPSNDSQLIMHAFKSLFKAYRQKMMPLSDQDALRRPTRNQIYAALYETTYKMNNNDHFIFYFAGHGNTINNEFYIFPSDYDDRVPKESAISINTVIEIVAAKARKKLFIFDCCRKFFPLQSAKIAELGMFNYPMFLLDENSYIISSCSNGQASYEMYNIEGQINCRGVFSYFLEKAIFTLVERHMKDSRSITLYDVFDLLRSDTSEWIAQAISKHQVPKLHGGNSNDWYILH